MTQILGQKGLVELILSSSMVIIMTMMLIHFIKSEWKNKSGKVGLRVWRLPPHTLCVFISYICYLIYSFKSMVLSCYWLLYAAPNHTFYPPLCIIHYIQPVWYTFGKVAMYLFWFIRLYQVFQSTLFAIPVRKLKCLALTFNIPITILAMCVQCISISP